MIRTLKRFSLYIRKYTLQLIVAFVFTALSVCSTLAVPVLIGEAVDCAVEKGLVDFEGLLSYIILIICAALCSTLFKWLSSIMFGIASSRCIRDIRSAAYTHVQKLSLSDIGRGSHGKIINKITNDPEQISDGLLNGIIQLFEGVLTIAGTLIVMLMTNLTVGLIVALLTPVSLFVASFIAKGSYKYFVNQTILQSELSGVADEAFSAQKLLNTAMSQDASRKKFKEVNRKLMKCGAKAQFFSALVNPSTRLVNNMIYAVVGIFGAVFCIDSIITVGQLSMLLTYSNQYSKPFNAISSIIAQLQSAFASLDRVLDLIDAAPETDGDEDMPDSRGNTVIEFKNVCFSYSNDWELIKNFCLKVNPGQHVAIIGATGSGKTTLINLLMRFYDVDSGEICVNGEDIRSYAKRSLRSSFGMVLQDSWIFNGTVFDNIAFGKPDATFEEVQSVAKKCYAHSFIKRLPNGYKTIIGDGTSLSQGQKQLLCIARAMLVSPEILVLDEATSEIDTLTEKKVKAAFDVMTQGKTSFVVAHRLSTVRDADLIIVMDDGKVVEQGTHISLMEAHGHYERLYKAMLIKS